MSYLKGVSAHVTIYIILPILASILFLVVRNITSVVVYLTEGLWPVFYVMGLDKSSFGDFGPRMSSCNYGLNSRF
jgi:hypothetical protein